MLGKPHFLIFFAGRCGRNITRESIREEYRCVDVTRNLGLGTKFSVYFGSSVFLQKVPSPDLWCQLSGSVTLAYTVMELDSWGQKRTSLWVEGPALDSQATNGSSDA